MIQDAASNKAIRLLAVSLRINDTLTCLRIQENEIDKEGLAAILESLEFNRTLKVWIFRNFHDLVFCSDSSPPEGVGCFLFYIEMAEKRLQIEILSEGEGSDIYLNYFKNNLLTSCIRILFQS